MTVQILENNGIPAFAVLPYNAYLNLLDKLKDAEDALAANKVRRQLNAGTDEAIPADMMRALVNSDQPIKIWREYRHLTMQTVADQVGISKSYLSQIEAGNRNGSADVLKRIAAALDVTLDDIVL